MLIGYSKDDLIMDPAGALRLYEAAKNSKRDMVEGTGRPPMRADQECRGRLCFRIGRRRRLGRIHRG